MHHTIGEFARSREHEQPAGIEVEPAYRYPLGAGQRRQTLEDARPAARIVAAGDLAFRLVIQQNARQPRRRMCAHYAARHLDLVGRAHARAYGGNLAIDGNAAAADQQFHVAPRPQAGLRQHFLQFLRSFGCRWRRGTATTARSGRRPLRTFAPARGTRFARRVGPLVIRALAHGATSRERRSMTACASVPLSTCSSSPPTGRPRAMRLTLRSRASSNSAM